MERLIASCVLLFHFGLVVSYPFPEEYNYAYQQPIQPYQYSNFAQPQTAAIQQPSEPYANVGSYQTYGNRVPFSHVQFQSPAGIQQSPNYGSYMYSTGEVPTGEQPVATNPAQQSYQQVNGFNGQPTSRTGPVYYPSEHQLPHVSQPAQWINNSEGNQNNPPQPQATNAQYQAPQPVQEPVNPFQQIYHHYLKQKPSLQNPSGQFPQQNEHWTNLWKKYSDNVPLPQQEKKRYLVIHPDGTTEYVDKLDAVAKKYPNYHLVNAGTLPYNANTRTVGTAGGPRQQNPENTNSPNAALTIPPENPNVAPGNSFPPTPAILPQRPTSNVNAGPSAPVATSPITGPPTGAQPVPTISNKPNENSASNHVAINNIATATTNVLSPRAIPTVPPTKNPSAIATTLPKLTPNTTGTPAPPTPGPVTPAQVTAAPITTPTTTAAPLSAQKPVNLVSITQAPVKTTQPTASATATASATTGPSTLPPASSATSSTATITQAPTTPPKQPQTSPTKKPPTVPKTPTPPTKQEPTSKTPSSTPKPQSSTPKSATATATASTNSTPSPVTTSKPPIKVVPTSTTSKSNKTDTPKGPAPTTKSASKDDTTTVAPPANKPEPADVKPPIKGPIDVSEFNTNDPIVWFKSNDSEILSKLIGNDPFTVVYFIQIHPPPTIEKDAKTTIYPDGSRVEEVIETIWDNEDGETKVTKKVTVIPPDGKKP